MEFTSELLLSAVLGVFTLGVAVWAGWLANQSNKLAKKLAEEAAAIDARRRRLPFVSEVMALAGLILSYRLLNQDWRISPQFWEHFAAASRTEIAADDPTAKHVTVWVKQRAFRSPLASGAPSMLALVAELGSVVEVWIEDPQAALLLIGEDPLYLRMQREPGDEPLEGF